MGLFGGWSSRSRHRKNSKVSLTLPEAVSAPYQKASSPAPAVAGGPAAAAMRPAPGIAIHRHDLDVASHPCVDEAITALARQSNAELQIAQYQKPPAHADLIRRALQSAHYFRSMPAQLLEVAVGAFENTGEIRKGTPIVHQAQTNGRCFVVLDGTFASSSDKVGKGIVLSEWSCGEIIGEPALSTPRGWPARKSSVTISCTSVVGRLFALRVEVYHRLLDAQLRMLDASAAAAGSPPAKAATPGVESAYAQATALFAAARATETAVWMVRSGELQLSVRGSTWEASGQPVTLRYARGDLLAARTLVELSVDEAVQATVSLPPLALTLSSADDAQNSASERAEAQHRRQLIGASLAPSGHWDMLTLDALLRAASRVRWPAGHTITDLSAVHIVCTGCAALCCDGRQIASLRLGDHCGGVASPSASAAAPTAASTAPSTAASTAASTTPSTASSTAPSAAEAPLEDPAAAEPAWTVNALTPIDCLVIDLNAVAAPLEAVRALIAREHAYRHWLHAYGDMLTMAELSPGPIIGQGTFGRVRLATHTTSDELYAVKTVEKHRLEPGLPHSTKLSSALAERLLLATCDHPFLLKLISSYQSAVHLYYVSEIVRGGELMTLLTSKGRLDIESARFYLANVCAALAYLNDLSIAYRDLKPENLMLDSHGYCKLVDFGFCKPIDGRSYTAVGTPDYMPPEIVRFEAHGLSVDWWALGVLAFEMLLGRTPFAALSTVDPLDELREIFANILAFRGAADELGFPWFFSSDATAMIVHFLAPDPASRLSPAAAFAHAFLKPLDRKALEQRRVPPPHLPKVASASDTSSFGRVRETLDVAEQAAARNVHVDWGVFPGFRRSDECWATELVEKKEESPMRLRASPHAIRKGASPSQAALNA